MYTVYRSYLCFTEDRLEIFICYSRKLIRSLWAEFVLLINLTYRFLFYLFLWRGEEKYPKPPDCDFVFLFDLPWTELFWIWD
ncbi:hypothetical protein GDO78_022089 [Eleutherodactylus coqui]|uniref:Uncharacterized protein n=1 Tax=Eleutherodactylus coqui TaxID=57060 RepID=A0A8J6B462_ELECQ|nr:hypothetical protein GDO78_022089 [Eleutherodactylus coqui]